MSQAYHDALTRRLSSIGNLGTTALNDTQNLMAQRNAAVAQQRAAQEQANLYGAIQQGARSTPSVSNSGGGVKYKGTGQDTFDNFIHAIAGRESGGNYNARNPDSGAMGKYQIMPGNIAGTHRGWDYQILGRDISTSQFMGSPQLQEAIAQGMLKNYYNKWGPGGAAVAWYAGPGAVNGWMSNHSSNRYTRPQGKYSSINAYAQGILRSMGLI